MAIFTTLCTSTSIVSVNTALSANLLSTEGSAKRGRKQGAIMLLARTAPGEEVTADSVIYVRKDGRQPYSIELRIRDVEDMDALIKLLEVQKDAADRGHVDPRSVPLDAVASFWMDEHKPAEKEPRSVKKRYRDAVSKWELMLTRWPVATLGDLNKAECRNYANWRTGINKPGEEPCPRVCGSLSTVHGDLTLLAKAIIEYAAAHQLSWTPPIWVPKKDGGRLFWLNRKKVSRIDWAIRGRIWDHSTANWKKKFNEETGNWENELRDENVRSNRRKMFRFRKIGVELGLRNAALMAMGWSAHRSRGYFDLENGVVHRGGHSIDPTVGKPRLSSFMPTPLVWWLKRWKAQDLARGIDRVIHKLDGTGYGGSLNELWKEIIADAGLSSDFTPHTLRHTCATWLKHLRVDVQTAADYLGMHPKTLLRTYGQWSIQGSRWAADAFGDRKLLRDLERSFAAEEGVSKSVVIADGKASAEDEEGAAPPRAQKKKRVRAEMSEETRQRVSEGMTAVWRRRKGGGDALAAIL